MILEAMYNGEFYPCETVVPIDLPGTVNVPGVFQSVINMDYVFTPITQERMVMRSSKIGRAHV